jgi:hypothetical protein
MWGIRQELIVELGAQGAAETGNPRHLQGLKAFPSM